MSAHLSFSTMSLLLKKKTSYKSLLIFYMLFYKDHFEQADKM